MIELDDAGCGQIPENDFVRIDPLDVESDRRRLVFRQFDLVARPLDEVLAETCFEETRSLAEELLVDFEFDLILADEEGHGAVLGEAATFSGFRLEISTAYWVLSSSGFGCSD